MKQSLTISGLCLFLAGWVTAQSFPITFGTVTTEELTTDPLPQEKGAEAIVLGDFTTARMGYYEGYHVEYTRHIRIKIFKSSGYALANIQIPYAPNDKIKDLRALTHNLEDSLPVSIAVDKKQIFREKVSAYRSMVRFTFPNVREGSVIEYTYTIVQQEIRGFRGVKVQRSIPVRRAEYLASIPGIFRYNITLSHPEIIQQQHITENGFFNSKPLQFDKYLWSAFHIPPFEPEPMMPEGDDFLAGVEFTLASVNMPGIAYSLSSSYAEFTQELLDNSIIGHQLDNTMFFTGRIQKLVNLQDPPQEKMLTIYHYVCEQMRWNGRDQLFPSVSLQRALREGTGSNAEINLLLVYLLRLADIQAYPVIMGTRSSGKINRESAMSMELNYLICLADIEGQPYLLDATDKFRPAGMLPYKCLNDSGWVLDKNQGRWIGLLRNEKYSTQESYDLILTDQGELTGNATVTFSGYDALRLRRLIRNEGEQGFRDQEFPHDGRVIISDLHFSGVDSINAALKITFRVTFGHVLGNAGEVLFFSPLISLLGNYFNPWIKDDRKFPLDLGCPSLDHLNCRIRLPERFTVQEIPGSIRIQMPENDARFLMAIAQTGNSLLISAELSVSRTVFDTHEYPSFREFYTQVNRKCNEMVILKNHDAR
jgi:hypothetical protein